MNNQLYNYVSNNYYKYMNNLKHKTACFIFRIDKNSLAKHLKFFEIDSHLKVNELNHKEVFRSQFCDDIECI